MSFHVALCCLILFNCAATLGVLQIHPDAGLTSEEQILKYNYPFENHFITTEDGYILSAHRIPFGKGSSNSTRNRRVVLLMPGIWRSSEIWINFGPERSLAFILADTGYDVWLGNYRGTTWSRRHVRWDADQHVKQFWNYSLDELGYYDCPAFIDYILKTTVQSSLTYIGETVGATMFFIMAAEKPAYMEKVKLMIAFAPMVDIGKAKSPLYPILTYYKKQIQTLADYFGVYEILKRSKPLVKLGILLCSDLVLRNLCELQHTIGVGFDSQQLNKSTIPVLLNGFPAGSSLNQIFHISQLYKTGVFAKYDYGRDENLKRYGEPIPPGYYLGGITTPTAIFYGGNDILVDKTGVERFSSKLNNVISKTYIRQFNNGDFTWAKDVVKLIYKDVLRLLKLYGRATRT